MALDREIYALVRKLESMYRIVLSLIIVVQEISFQQSIENEKEMVAIRWKEAYDNQAELFRKEKVKRHFVISSHINK